MIDFTGYKILGHHALYTRIPIQYLDLFRAVNAAHGKFFRIRYRGPRFNIASSRGRGYISMASTCLKSDATHFSVYRY